MQQRQTLLDTLEALADAKPDCKQDCTDNSIKNQNQLHIVPPHAVSMKPCTPTLLQMVGCFWCGTTFHHDLKFLTLVQYLATVLHHNLLHLNYLHKVVN